MLRCAKVEMGFPLSLPVRVIHRKQKKCIENEDLGLKLIIFEATYPEA